MGYKKLTLKKIVSDNHNSITELSQQIRDLETRISRLERQIKQ